MKYTGNYSKLADYNIANDEERKISFILDKDLNVLKKFTGLSVREWFNESTLFVNGLTVIHTFFSYDGDMEQREYFLINENFNILNVAPFEYINYQWFGDSLQFQANGKYGYINAKLEYVLPPEIEEIDGDDDKYYYSFIDIKRNGSWGRLDFDLKELIPVIYDEILYVYYDDYIKSANNTRGSEQIACVLDKNGKYGAYFIDQKFENPNETTRIFTGCKYDEIVSLKDEDILIFKSNDNEIDLFIYPGRCIVEYTNEKKTNEYHVEKIRF